MVRSLINRLNPWKRTGRRGLSENQRRGISETAAIFENPQMGRQLARDVFERADYTCERCDALCGHDGYEIPMALPKDGDEDAFRENNTDPDAWHALCSTCFDEVQDQSPAGELPDLSDMMTGYTRERFSTHKDERDGPHRPRPKSNPDSALRHGELEARMPFGWTDVAFNPIGQAEANRYLPLLQPAWKFPKGDRPRKHSYFIRTQRRVWRRLLNHQDKDLPLIHVVYDYAKSTVLRFAAMVVTVFAALSFISGAFANSPALVFVVPAYLLALTVIFVLYPFESKYDFLDVNSVWHRLYGNAG